VTLILVVDALHPRRQAEFCAAPLGWTGTDGDGGASGGWNFELVFTEVDVPKTVKNRIHLELVSRSSEHQAEIVRQALGLGAGTSTWGRGCGVGGAGRIPRATSSACSIPIPADGHQRILRPVAETGVGGGHRRAAAGRPRRDAVASPAHPGRPAPGRSGDHAGRARRRRTVVVRHDARRPAAADGLPAVQHGGPGGAFRIHLLDVVEQRLDPAVTGFKRGRPTGRGVFAGWLRLTGGADWDPLSLVVAVDAMPPIGYDLGAPGWAPTMQLSAHVCRLPAPGPIRIHVVATEVDGGQVDHVVRAWDSKDRLVVQASQICARRLPSQSVLFELIHVTER
jgi:hypothetical protein